MTLSKKQRILGALLLLAGVVVIAVGLILLFGPKTPEVQDQPQPPDAGVEDGLGGGGPGGSSNGPSLGKLAATVFDGRNMQRGEVLAATDAYTQYYIEYKSGELTISGIMNVPTGEVPEGGFPVLILNHGYIDPAVYTNGRGLRREQAYFAQNGYVVVHSDYRNHANSTKVEDADTETFRLGYAEDVINAIYALRETNFDFIDEERMGMLGHSMGGGIAQQIMVTHPDLVDAVMLYAPVSSDAYENFDRWVLRGRQEAAQEVLAAYGGLDENPQFWEALSPRTYFDEVSIPVQLHHGSADESVPLQWSRDTAHALQEAGKEAELFEYEGEGHEFAAAWPTVMQRTLAFFDEHVKGVEG